MAFAAKYKGFCSHCHMTVWQGERVKWAKRKRGVEHLNCLRAFDDPTPRVLDDRFSFTPPQLQGGRVRFVSGGEDARSRSGTQRRRQRQVLAEVRARLVAEAEGLIPHCEHGISSREGTGW